MSLKNLQAQPSLIQGGLHKDERGSLCFVNGWDMEKIKRFYIIEHPVTGTIRAWQAHKIEEKYFLVINGGFKIVLVKPDDWEKPSSQLPVQEYMLEGAATQLLHIPGGYATGIRATEPDSRLLIFSTLDISQAAGDDYRFPTDYWYNWNH